MNKLFKQLLSGLLAVALIVSLMPTVGFCALAADSEPERVFPYPGHTCEFKGKTVEQLNAILQENGYNTLRESPVAGTSPDDENADYYVAGDCVWVYSPEKSKDGYCEWESAA